VSMVDLGSRFSMRKRQFTIKPLTLPFSLAARAHTLSSIATSSLSSSASISTSISNSTSVSSASCRPVGETNGEVEIEVEIEVGEEAEEIYLRNPEVKCPLHCTALHCTALHCTLLLLPHNTPDRPHSSPPHIPYTTHPTLLHTPPHPTHTARMSRTPSPQQGGGSRSTSRPLMTTSYTQHPYVPLLCCVVLCCVVLCCVVLCCVVLCCVVLCCVVLCCVVLCCVVFYCTVLYSTVLYCTVLCYTTMHSTVLLLHCTALFALSSFISFLHPSCDILSPHLAGSHYPQRYKNRGRGSS
jgi:hypothetical protein